MKKRKGCIFRIKTWEILESVVLALIMETPDHGYSLVERISEFGINPSVLEQGVIYRILRNLEQRGLISSKWETEGSGAAKRIYNISEEGKTYLINFVGLEREKVKKLNEIFIKIDTLLKKESEYES